MYNIQMLQGTTSSCISQTFTLDTTAPTVDYYIRRHIALNIDEDSNNNSRVLRSVSTGFTSSDLTATGGTLSAFTGSGTTYTAILTPSTTQQLML